MTLQFDKKSIDKEKNQQRLFDILSSDDNCKACKLKVKEVPISFARPFIATYHYSQTMPDSTMECYAGYYGDKLAGIITFGNGANNKTFTSLIPDIELKNSRELTRLWSPDGMPKNTESKLISESIKLLPDKVNLVVSFADPSHNHNGIIYQATNFYYCGKSLPSKMIKTKEDNLLHVRTIGTYKRRHPELKGLTNKEIMKKYGWLYCDSPGKHRYVLLRGSKWLKNLMLEKIRDRILPYPKLKN